MVVKSYSGCEIMAGAPPALAPRSPHALVASSLSRVAERGVEPQWSPEPPTRHTRHTQQADTRRERESLFRWSVLGVLGVLGARQLALPGGAEQPSLHASAAEDLPSPGSARRREAAKDNLLSRAYGTAAAPDRAHDRAYADLLARDRTVQPGPYDHGPDADQRGESSRRKLLFVRWQAEAHFRLCFSFWIDRTIRSGIP